MILSYSKESFKADILAGRKIHTLREDWHERWHAGRTIHHWMHNPRNVAKNPHHFLTNECTGVECALIQYDKTQMTDMCIRLSRFKPVKVITGSIHTYYDYEMDQEQILELATNDGLTLPEFREWFLGNKNYWQGKIIHWTDHRYHPALNQGKIK